MRNATQARGAAAEVGGTIVPGRGRAMGGGSGRRRVRVKRARRDPEPDLTLRDHGRRIPQGRGVVADSALRFRVVSRPLGLEGWAGPEGREDVRAAGAQAQ